MKRLLTALATAAACFCISTTQAATVPFVQFVAASGGLANTCAAGNAAPSLLANVDLSSGASYRYEIAFLIIPTDMDMGMMGDMYMMMMMDDTTPYYGLLYQSPAINGPATSGGAKFNIVAPAQWYTALPSVADHTTIMAQVMTYTGPNGTGTMASTTSMSWDCTTGQALAVANIGNADGAVLPAGLALVQAVEYYNASEDHYFVTTASAEIGALDAGQLAGWARTGNNFNAFGEAVAGASPVCRFYLPPVYGDSHFFSASPAECAAVQAGLPQAVLESANAFYIDTPDATTGACPAGTIAVYRLWNHRADTNHRYTTDATIKAAMIGKGYVAEGYGPDAVAMCSPQ